MKVCRPDRHAHWNDEVYGRIFVTYDAAVKWWLRHKARGCPSHPFHLNKFITRARHRAQELAAFSKDYLAALTCAAMAEAASQNHQAVVVKTRHAHTHQACRELCSFMHAANMENIGPVHAG